MTRTPRYTRKMLYRAIASAQGQGLLSISYRDGAKLFQRRNDFVVVIEFPDGTLMRSDVHPDLTKEMSPREASRALGLDA